jgi:hypothetical protein
MIKMENVKKIITIISVLFLSGCASQILKSYVGKDIKEAILDYGPPINVLELSKTQKAFQWADTSSYTIPTTVNTHGNSFGNATAYGNTAYGSGTYSGTTTITGGQTYQNTCIYTLIADKKDKYWIVTSFRKPSFGCE